MGSKRDLPREPNHRLRQARERTRSKIAPGEMMSLREVAEAVNAFLFRTTDRVYDFDAHHLAKLERGVICWPMAPYRAGLRAVLDATDDAELGFVRPQRGAAPPSRAVVAPSASLMTSAAWTQTALAGRPTAFLDQITVQTPMPGRIGWTDVDHVQATTEAFATSENMFGGGLSCEAAAGQLRWASRFLEAPAPNDIRRDMHVAVGNLAGVVAFSAFDIANYTAAEQYFRFTLWCADQAGSWALRASTLADMARKAIYLGNHDEALSLIEFAQVRSDRLTATTRAMLAAVHARLLALAGRYKEARAEVDRADEYFASADPQQDPPWMCYYDDAEHHGSTARALTPEAIATGTYEVVAGRLTAAIKLHGPHYPRSRAFSRARLATLQMSLGHPAEAIETGRVAVAEAGTFRSDRMRHELQLLNAAAGAHPKNGEVADMRHDIAGFLCST